MQVTNDIDISKGFHNSNAGKFVPSISYKIHNENLLDNPGVPINFRGFAVGNGMMAPENQMVYGDFLYEVMGNSQTISSLDIKH